MLLALPSVPLIWRIASASGALAAVAMAPAAQATEVDPRMPSDACMQAIQQALDSSIPTTKVSPLLMLLACGGLMIARGCV